MLINQYINIIKLKVKKMGIPFLLLFMKPYEKWETNLMQTSFVFL